MFKGKLVGASALAMAAWFFGASGSARAGEAQPADAGPVTMTTDYTLDGANADLTQSLVNTGSFTVGVAAGASLKVESGVSVTTTPATPHALAAVIGEQSTSSGGVTLVNVGIGNPGLFQVNGNLVLGNYGVGQLGGGGSLVVQGDLILGQSGAGRGSINLTTSSKTPVMVQGRTRLGVAPLAQGNVSIVLPRAQTATFNYGRRLEVGVSGYGSFVYEGALTVAPTPSNLPSIIEIGSQDPSSNFYSGNSIIVGGHRKLGSTLIGDMLLIDAGTHQVNELKIGVGSQVTLSQSLVVNDNADLVMSGGVLTVPRITQFGTGQIFGNGTINGPVQNNVIRTTGKLPPFIDRASTDILTINGAVSGPNTVLTIYGVTLALTGPVGEEVHVNFPSTGRNRDLDLGDPASMAGQISYFVHGDNIDLIGRTPVTHAYHDHGDGTGALSMSFADGSFAQLNFVGSYASTQFGFIADGAGGTRIFLR